jgi:MHS family shikimate/dehydroshikimate transporter-like MFS transporter
LFIRARVPETPVFEDKKSRGELSSNPVAEAILRHPKAFLLAVGLKISEVSWVYILTVFVVIYATNQLGLPRGLMLTAVIVASLVEVLTIPLFGHLSDLYGRRSLYFFGSVFTALFAFPLFWILETRNPAAIIVAMTVALSLGHGTMFGILSTYLPELFGTRVRYTGASFGFQVAAAIGGGLAPILATSLTSSMGGTAGVSILLIALAAITFVATLAAPETKDISLSD